jgi:FMN phosphatase YigB (HAD superfamily)
VPADVARVSRGGSRRVDAVTFDFWETLCQRRPGALERRRAELISVVLADIGVVIDADVLDAAMTAVWAVYVEAWNENRQFSGDDAARWVAGSLAERESALSEPGVQARVVEAFHGAADDAELLLVAGVAETLDALSAAGVRLGIVCDVGFIPSPGLRQALHRHGVLERFDHWSFSDEVGAFKPDRRIFEHALAGLGGVAPARTAHVGDIRRTDIAGAQAMGMLAIRFRGVSDDRSPEHPEADIVIDAHQELIDHLL